LKISQEGAILIKKSLSVKAVWCTKAVEWICPFCWQLARVGNLEASTVC